MDKFKFAQINNLYYTRVIDKIRMQAGLSGMEQQDILPY